MPSIVSVFSAANSILAFCLRHRHVVFVASSKQQGTMSIPTGFDSIEEIANLALFTRAKQKTAFRMGMIGEKNRVEMAKATGRGSGYFEWDSRDGLITPVAHQDIESTAARYLLPASPSTAKIQSTIVRGRYLDALGYKGRTLQQVNWETAANMGFIESKDGSGSRLIHRQGMSAHMDRIRQRYGKS